MYNVKLRFVSPPPPRRAIFDGIFSQCHTAQHDARSRSLESAFQNTFSIHLTAILIFVNTNKRTILSFKTKLSCDPKRSFLTSAWITLLTEAFAATLCHICAESFPFKVEVSNSTPSKTASPVVSTILNLSRRYFGHAQTIVSFVARRWKARMFGVWVANQRAPKKLSTVWVYTKHGHTRLHIALKGYTQPCTT